MFKINYDPDPWAYSAAKVDADFAKIKDELSADTVRLFASPYVFGYPTPDALTQASLATTVGLAANHGLAVHLTLFDSFPDYTIDADAWTWATAMLAPYKTDPRVSIVEVKNEVVPTSQPEMAWVKAMLPYVKGIVPSKQVTVSLADTGTNTVASRVAHFQALRSELGPSPHLDFFDCHFYGSADQAVETFAEWKKIAGVIPLAVSEIGQSTALVPQQTQANYLANVIEAARKAGLPVGVWTLNDFPWLTGRESGYGLYLANGMPKLSVAAVRHAATMPLLPSS